MKQRGRVDNYTLEVGFKKCKSHGCAGPGGAGDSLTVAPSRKYEAEGGRTTDVSVLEKAKLKSSVVTSRPPALLHLHNAWNWRTDSCAG